MKNKLKQLYQKLKDRWGVETLGQVVVILIIFSITGITTLYVKRFLFDMLGFNSETATWVKGLAWVLAVLPAYQVLFLFYGFLLGQFNFVWEFEKRSFRKIKKLFTADS
ncbi:MAG: DUF6787 family protein [Balneolaceae bacterium]|nr:DUF6787 family protein [Balneolaceae bacterium]